MKEKLTLGTKYLLDFMFYAGIAVTATLPFSIRFYGRYNSYFARYWIPLVVMFGISGVLAVLLILELRRMFQSVLEDNCFVRENVRSLRRMGAYSFCIAAVTTSRLFLYLTPAVVVVTLVFVIAGLFSWVLARVFDTAVTYKEENDLTI